MRTHRVICASCGRRGRIRISPRTGKILSKSFYFFGTVDLSAGRTSKYVYELVFDNDGLKKDSNGGLVTVRKRNENYDPKAKHYYVEYWECKRCYG
jgi:hypothetical protein